MKRSAFGLLATAIAISACSGGNNNPGGPSNFSVTVTSANTNVLFNTTEQMTATSSDGHALSGSWTTDNPAVATVNATGLVTPVGAGQAHVIFTASSGQQGNKLIRGVPNLGGTTQGSYQITGCTATGQFLDANLCGQLPAPSAPYLFHLSQSGDAVTGDFFLGTIDFPGVNSTISLGGALTMHAIGVTPATIKIDATWNLDASQPARLAGTVAHVWTSPDVTGQMNVTGTISNASRSARVPTSVVPASLGDAVRSIGR